MSMTLDLSQVNEAIKKSGLKKKWIAQQIGVSKDSLGAYLSGRKKTLSKSAMILLAHVLNLNEASGKAS